LGRGRIGLGVAISNDFEFCRHKCPATERQGGPSDKAPFPPSISAFFSLFRPGGSNGQLARERRYFGRILRFYPKGVYSGNRIDRICGWWAANRRRRFPWLLLGAWDYFTRYRVGMIDNGCLPGKVDRTVLYRKFRGAVLGRLDRVLIERPGRFSGRITPGKEPAEK